MEGVNKDILNTLKAELAENKSKSSDLDGLKRDLLNPDFTFSLLPKKKSEAWISLQKGNILSLIKHFLKKNSPIIESLTDVKSDIKTCVISVPNLYTNDAVSNDTLMLAKALRNAGYETYIYSKTYVKEVEHEQISKLNLFKLLSSPHTLLIYNHCVYWPDGSEYIAKARGQVWFRYHNVTPSEFFAPYDPISTFSTQNGIKQTVDIIHRLDTKITRYLPVSPFNSQDLIKLGVSPEKVHLLPPFHRVHDFENSSLDHELNAQLQDGKVNLLFVGRIVPNKGFDKLIATLEKYIQFYGNNVRLTLVGGLSDNFKSYFDQLNSMIEHYNLTEYVHWVGKTSFETLHTYYMNADVFLLFSEHEGFCLPILEAQAHGVPILAVNKTAIRETMGSDQLCFTMFDPELLATAINKILKDKQLREKLVHAGLQNLEKYKIENLNKTLIDFVRLPYE